MKNNFSSVKFLWFGLILISGMVLSSGCSNQNVSSNPKDSALNLPFSIRSLMSVVIRKADIARDLGKPDVTRIQTGYSYEIRNLPDGSRLFIIYGSDNVVEDIWRFKKLFDRSDFDKIVAGKSTATDVKNIDPYFQTFEGLKNEDLPTSEHRLKDGGLIIIGYEQVDNDWIVKSINYKEQDPSGFVSKILPEDR